MYHFDWAVFLEIPLAGDRVPGPAHPQRPDRHRRGQRHRAGVGRCLGTVRRPGQDVQVLSVPVLADVYIWYFRGTPLLVQMMLLFFGLGVTHIYDFPDRPLGS